MKLNFRIMDTLPKIKFGTDGWRAVIAREYTVDNLKRLTHAVGVWMNKNGKTSVVIGHDCRFGGAMFTEVVETHLRKHGIKVFRGEGFVSTPMISLGVVLLKADIGIVITASHNPPTYNGFKLKSHFGGATPPTEIMEVENLVPDTMAEIDDYAYPDEEGSLEIVDLEQMYIDQVEKAFDLEKIKDSGIKLAYDAMYGAGQNVVRRLFPDAHHLHCEWNPGFHGQAPEPIHKNLREFSEYIKNHDIDLGLANDGDADRIGLYDPDGNFIDAHHILLLLLHYLHNYKKVDGDMVVSTFSVTDKLGDMARSYGYKYVVKPIGFKYIAELMTTEKVLVGGEESGGIAAAGHIPERDGVWMGLLIMEFMAVTGKSIKELIADVYAEVGSFACDRDDRHVSEDVKQDIIQKCKSGYFKQFGKYKVQQVDDLDGFKFRLGNDRWVMIRPSGTEAVLRIYAQAENAAEVRKVLDATQIEIGIGRP